MRNSFPCFSKVISLSNGGSSSVTLTNASGGVYHCNYVQIDSRSEGAGDQGYYHVFPSGVYVAYTEASSTSSSPTASGVGGLIGVADGSVEYLAPNHIRITQIFIKNILGANGVFAIRYGVLLGANEERDKQIFLDYNGGRL